MVAVTQDHYGVALSLFVVAGVSDGLDGFLAKRFGWTSRLGSLLDPIADKLLLVTSYVLLGWKGELPWWLVAAVLARDIIIIGGGITYHLVISYVQMAPTLLSKFNTVLQIALVVVIFYALWSGPPLLDLREGMIYTVLATTVFSGAHYVWVWGRRAFHAGHGGVA